MKIVNFKIENPICVYKDKASTLVIENPDFFAYTVTELDSQIKGNDGTFLLYKNDKEVKLSSSVMLVIDPISLAFNDRKIISRIYAKLSKLAYDSETYLSTQELLSSIEIYMNKLFDKLNYSLCYDDIDLSALFRFCGIKIQQEYESLLEKLIDYINLLIELGIADLLVLVNIKSYIGYSDLQELYKHCAYKDFYLLLIESENKTLVDDERVLIIDNDLCEMLVNDHLI